MTIDKAKVDRAIEDATRQTALKFSAYVSLEWITANLNWGEPYGTRDIVDTGQLRASQRIEETSKNAYRIYWTAEHALYVHEGYTVGRSRRRMPARPFARQALDTYNFEDQFRTQFQKNIG